MSGRTLESRNLTVAIDTGASRQVPPEAYRRFGEDYNQRRERNLDIHGHQLALHAERDRFIADRVHQHGTPDPREGLAKGMLALKEILDSVADGAFAAAATKTETPTTTNTSRIAPLGDHTCMFRVPLRP